MVADKLWEKTYFGVPKVKNMSVRVDQYIAELLFQQDKVVVPGLGTFSLSYKSSQTDPVQGMLTPPVKEVSFRRSLEGSADSALAQHISAAEQVSEEQAKQWVEDYVQHAREKLQRKDLVIIDQVGRLYVDFEGALQFLPDTTNFDTETYGLPPISAQPIPTPPEPTTTTTPTATRTIDTRSTGLGGFMQRNLGAVIGVALLLVVVLILALSYQRFFGEQTEDPIARVPEDRHNVAPPPADSNQEGEPPALDFPLDDAANGQSEADADGDDYDDSETETITPAPNQREAIIAIGVFRDTDNVNKLVERIYKVGYEPYLDKRGDRTRVGLQLSYQDFSEVQKALELARSEFAPDAFIMER